MGHFKIDPLTFFYEHSEFIPNKAQKNIINAMDSCQFTIIPGDRACGTSTAIKLYMEWEFLHSKEPISLVYSTMNRWEAEQGFHRLNFFRKQKDLYRNNENKLETQTINEALSPHYYRGCISPDNLYVFDGLSDNTSIDKVFEIIYYMVLPRKNSRFVIVTDKPSQFVNKLVDGGIDENQIGLVDMADCSYHIQYYKQMGVQPIMRQTGQIFTLNLPFQP